MKDVVCLTKVLLKNASNKTNNQKLGIKILLAVAIAYVAIIIGYISYELIDALAGISQEEVFLSILFMIAILLTFFKTITTTLNVMYFSKDVEFLLPLPMKPIKIVLSKMNVMLISEYISEILILAVPFGVYGYMMSEGIVFYLTAFVIFLFLPVIPMLISMVLVVLIMRFTKFFKNKDVVQYLSILITLGIVIAVQYFATSSNTVTTFMISNKLLEVNGLSSMFSKYLFILEQATDAITNLGAWEGIKNLLLLAGESILLYFAVAIVISKVYIKTAVAATFSGKKAGKINLKRNSKHGVAFSYLRKELKMLNRTPVYTTQCVLPTIILPIVIAIPIYRNFVNATSTNTDALLSAVGETISSSGGMGMGIILVIINFLYMFNFISVTAISRDGENATFMKYIPVELHKQCKYKVLPSIILNLVPLIFVVGGIGILLTDVTTEILVGITIVGLLCNILISYIAIFIDITRPKLHWSSEYSVVKQNLNMLYDAIIVILVMVAILGISSYIDNVVILTAVLSGICIAILVFYEIFLRKFQKQIFKKIS